MTDIDKRIDEIMELDKARTQGNLMQYIEITAYDSDVDFVKAAPEMVSIIAELRSELTQLKKELANK